MTKEAINKAIAESLGRNYHKPTAAEVASGSYFQYEPDFTSDLNAMHSAEKVLTKEQGETYAGLLCDAVDKDDSDKGKHAGFAVAHATAGQRAECFLRAIKRWEE